MVILGIPCILSISNLASILLFCVKIPNPGLQKRHIPHPDKPIGETRQWISFFRVLTMSRSQWGIGTTKKSTVNSLLTDTCLTRTPGVGPCRFLVNYTLHKTDTSLRRTTDNGQFWNGQTVNGHLRSALCSEKYVKREMYMLSMTVNCRIFNILKSCSSSQSAYCYTFRPRNRERYLIIDARLIAQYENDSTFLL